jgi:hypothetical protein
MIRIVLDFGVTPFALHGRGAINAPLDDEVGDDAEEFVAIIETRRHQAVKAICTNRRKGSSHFDDKRTNVRTELSLVSRRSLSLENGVMRVRWAGESARNGESQTQSSKHDRMRCVFIHGDIDVNSLLGSKSVFTEY